MSHKNIKLAATIVNCGTGNRAAAIFHTCSREILLAVRGHDTVSSAVMDCLGPDEPEKDLVLGLSSKTSVDCLFRTSDREMEFCKPGRDTALTLPLTGISFTAANILSRHKDQAGPNSRPAEHKKGVPVTGSHFYELIASVVHTDLSAPVIEAAKEVSCQDGILIKAKETSSDAGKKLFGMTLSQEKAILLTLTPTNLRTLILKFICGTIMRGTGEYVVVISLPVDAVEGLTGRCWQKKPPSFWDESFIVDIIKRKQVHHNVRR